MIKKKCTECGTLHPLEHATECTGCGEQTHLRTVCIVCEKRSSLSGHPTKRALGNFLYWLEGPSVNQSGWKSMLGGSLVASFLTFFCLLNNFTFIGGGDGNWAYHLNGWFTALTAGILTSQLLWRLNLSFVSIRGGKLVIAFCCGTMMTIVLNASWVTLLFNISPSGLLNAIAVLPIFWWSATMNSKWAEECWGSTDWGKFFYYGRPYFPWRQIWGGKPVTTGLKIQVLSRAKTLFCIGISVGTYIFALWLLIWELPSMAETAKQREADGLSSEQIKRRIKGINPRHPL